MARQKRQPEPAPITVDQLGEVDASTRLNWIAYHSRIGVDDAVFRDDETLSNRYAAHRDRLLAEVRLTDDRRYELLAEWCQSEGIWPAVEAVLQQHATNHVQHERWHRTRAPRRAGRRPIHAR